MLAQAPVPALAGGAESSVGFVVSDFPRAGDVTLHLVADADGQVAESVESDNLAVRAINALKPAHSFVQRRMTRAKSCSMNAALNGPHDKWPRSSRAGATMACRARRSGSAAPTAFHRALRIKLTKSSLLADKLGPIGSYV